MTAPDAGARELGPLDLEQARHHLELLFEGVPGLIEVRPLPGADDLRVFAPTIGAALTAIERAAACNVNAYFGVATRRAPGDGTKANLRAVLAVWVDADFASEADRAEFMAALEKFPIPPSLIVWSGGGIHPYWFLDEPLAVDTADGIDRLERINRGLLDLLRGKRDLGTHNADRILRVAGTINYPNEKKRKAGRVPTSAKILSAPGYRYPLDTFAEIEERGRGLLANGKGRGDEAAGDQGARVPWNGELPPRVVWLLERREKLRARWNGDAAGLNDATDSGVDMAIANLLALEGLPSEEIENALRYRRARCGGKEHDASYFGRTAAEAIAWAASQRASSTGEPDAARVGASSQGDGLDGDDSFDSALESASPPWPTTLDPAAYYGLAGDVVGLLEPHTEADPAALLTQLLAMAGVAIGDGPYFEVEADRHPPRLNVVVVGKTSRARKGTSHNVVRSQFDLAQRPITVRSGLSSGEGLIWQVRDPITKKQRNRKGETEELVVDEGVEDKRLLVVESEFSQALRVVGRDGSTLAAVVRDAWDRGDLATLTKNSPARATGAHISIIGHITREELRRDLDRTDAASGFGNRFLWVCARRSKVLPDGGNLEQVDRQGAAEALASAIDAARPARRWTRDSAARDLWHSIYAALSEGRPGLLGSVTSRAEAQVVRLSLIYALLDAHTGCEATIGREHLEAALALWRYCADSARHIFDDAIGDPKADEALSLLRAAGERGMTRTELGVALFGRQNVTRDRLARALRPLLDYKLATRTTDKANGKGRPAERWFAARPFNPFSPSPLDKEMRTHTDM